MTDEPRTAPTSRRRRRLATGAAVLGAGALLAGPITAFAQQDGDETEDTVTEGTATETARRGGWIAEALDGLVSEGTLTQAQADAVSEALQAARPEHGRRGPFGGRGWLGRVGLDAAAEVLGIEEDDLREALRDGATLAELATREDVEVQAVIDALVAEGQERIDALVENGRLDADEAAEWLTQLTERVTTLVNDGFPRRRDRAGDDTTTDEDTPAPTTTTG